MNIKTCAFWRTAMGPIEAGLLVNDGDYIIDEKGKLVPDVYDYSCRVSFLSLDLSPTFEAIKDIYKKEETR